MGWAVLLRFMVQNLYEEALLSPLPKAGLGSNFTHPWVGQAEHLACRKRLPNACLRAEARTHFPLTGSYASLPHLKACTAENNIRAERDFCN